LPEDGTEKTPATNKEAPDTETDEDYHFLVQG
jgi:hypothetical protein